MIKSVVCILLFLVYQALSDNNPTTAVPVALAAVLNQTHVANPANTTHTPTNQTNPLSNATSTNPANTTHPLTNQTIPLNGANPRNPKNHTHPSGHTILPTTPSSNIQPSITKTEATLPHHKPTTEKNPRAAECGGWCLNSMSVNSVIKVKTNETADMVLNEKFAQMRNAVEKSPNFLVRVGGNVFADKSLYEDVLSNHSRTQLFEKNVIRVPSMMFYPYTRKVLTKAIADSGQLFIPHKKLVPMAARASDLNKEQYVPFLRNNAFIFENRYFERNPLLHTYKRAKKTRRYHNDMLVNFRKTYNKDTTIHNKESGETYWQNDEYRRNIPVNLKVIDINNFILDGSKARSSKKYRNRLEDILGTGNQDTVLEQPGNDIDNIIGGMKIGGKNASTFLIGKSKAARSKLNTWFASKSRAGKLASQKGEGVLINGKSRAKAIDNLLKSMINSYQYGNNDLTYKKL